MKLYTSVQHYNAFKKISIMALMPLILSLSHFIPHHPLFSLILDIQLYAIPISPYKQWNLSKVKFNGLLKLDSAMWMENNIKK